MDPVELAFAGIARQAKLVRAGEVSARELVELYLERIARIDPQLNSFRVVMGERALAEAEQAESRREQADERPLLGVPIAVKDNQDVAGELTTHGTNAYDRPATADGELVRRLRAAGAIVIGKTTLPELAICGFTESATWGVTRNPWDRQRTTGGSSGGSAAAVAAGLVGAASASDGAGSIRIPSANCGLFGLKPQRGRVSLMPDPQHWHGLSVAGCVARSVRDSALFLDVVAGAAAGDAHTAPALERPLRDDAERAPGKLRIAVSRKPMLPVPIADEVTRAFDETVELLRSLGHAVSEHELPWGALVTAFTPRYLHGIWEDGRAIPHPERLERRTRGFMRMGRAYAPAVVRWALEQEGVHAARIGRVFDDHDVVVTPTVARPPVELMRWEGRGAVWTLNGMSRVYPYTGAWNMLGNPAAAVPAGFTADGLPLSVQLVGRTNDEPTLVSLAAQLEAERPWAERRPELAAA